MYQKFWNQFLLEQEGAAEPTFNLNNDEPIKPDPTPKRSYPSPYTTGVGAYLLSKGYDLDSKLGDGVDGEVYER